MTNGGLSFGQRLDEAVSRFGPLCVGIDPHVALLKDWGLSDDARGAESFGRTVIEASAGRVAIVKPQVAFFERFGSAGIAALERVLADAREAGVLTIADAKRGDIGSTMDGYAEAWLSPGSPLEADSVTLSPYLGFGSLQPAIALAKQHGKGLFALAATSNPEGASVQAQGEPSVAASIAAAAALANADADRVGSIGLVIGATVRAADYGIELDSLVKTPILAPGFGAQGATAADLVDRFATAAPRVLVSESRSILSAGPTGLVDVIERERAAIAAVLHG